MKSDSKVSKKTLFFLLTLSFSLISFKTLVERKALASPLLQKFENPLDKKTTPSNFHKKKIKIAQNQEEKEGHPESLEDLKDIPSEENLSNPKTLKKSSWGSFFKRIFRGKEKSEKAPSEETISPNEASTEDLSPPLPALKKSLLESSESPAFSSPSLEKKELQLEKSHPTNSKSSFYERLLLASKKANLGPIASKAYAGKNGFHLGLTGEALNYSFKKELQEQKDQSTPSLATEVSKEYSKSHTSSGNIAFHLSHRSSLFRVFNRDVATLVNSKFRFSEWGIKKNTQVNANLKGSSSIEFAYIDFLFHPYFNLRLGNQLLPLGLTNPSQELLSHYSVKAPEIESVIIPERWHENGIQIWGGNLHTPSSFLYRYSLGGFNSLSALKENTPQFNAKNFVSQGVQDGQLAKTNDIALVGRLDLHFLKNSLFGGSIFYGNTTQDHSKEKIEARNQERNPNDAFYNFKNLNVLIWEIHLKIKTKLWLLKALFTQGVIPNAYKLSQKDEQGSLASRVLIGSRPESLSPEEAPPSQEPSSSPQAPLGRVAQGYYVTLGLNLLNVFNKHSQSELILFARYEEYNLHYVVPSNTLEDKTLLKISGTVGFIYTPPQKNFALKVNYKRRKNYYNKEIDFIGMSFGFAF